MKNIACFLDRDGVLIKEKNYLSSIDAVELEEGAAEAVRKLNESGILVVVVSNQSGVARNYFSESDVRKVNAHIDELLKKEEAAIDGWYYCPHHLKGTLKEYAVDCDCRKPEPGMLHAAARDFNIALADSFMIGDKFSDLECAVRAGCRRAILVRTGHGESELVKKDGRDAEVADNILCAVELLLKKD